MLECSRTLIRCASALRAYCTQFFLWNGTTAKITSHRYSQSQVNCGQETRSAGEELRTRTAPAEHRIDEPTVQL
ncbi:MAG: hypothetical protein LBF72_00175 [Holosporales bacterium]|nr:hypothetical protein [Holosporales bacterium]